MIFKSILVVVSIIQLTVCHPVSSDVSYCEFKYTDENVKYVAIDCKGNPLYTHMCSNLQMDANKGSVVSAVTLENCIAIEDDINLFANDDVDITEAIFLKNNTLSNGDFTSSEGLTVLVITEPKFQTTPASLQIEASELKWFEYDGKDDEAVNSITMDDPAKLVFFSMEETSVACFSDDFFKNATNLKMVRVPSNKIESIDSVKWPNSMKWLDVSMNKISQLSNKSYENLENLNILSMKDNNINEIKPGTFEKMNHLMYLSMQQNSLKEVKKGMFDGLSEVIAIDLDENKIEAIEAGAFEATPKLGALSLSENQIQSLNASTFSEMTHLRYVDMSWNPINAMAVETFANMSQLEKLDMSHCKLKFVDFNAFVNAWNLEDLDLSYNKIEHLVKMSPSHPTKCNVSCTSNSSQSATLESFKWMESVDDLGGEFMSDNVKSTFVEMFALSMAMDASSFGDIFNFKVFNLESSEDNEVAVAVPEDTWKLETLTLSGNQLTVVEKDVFAVFKNMKQLYLSNNPITTLYPESFAGLNEMTDLMMAHCKLTSVDFSMFAHMTKLEKLDMSHNKLATVVAAPMPSMQKLYMNSNQLTSLPMEKKDFPKLQKLNVKHNNMVCSALSTFADIKLMCEKHAEKSL